MAGEWTIYIIRAESGKLYTGITTDLQRRLKEHRSSKRGARFFRLSGPVEVVWSEQVASRSEASQRESEIKKMSRSQKEQLIAN